MEPVFSQKKWSNGVVPIAIIMISLNEAHNMDEVCRNLSGWASEVFLVDSFSSDETIDIALRHGVFVVQRSFCGFGDQWNFALNNLPIKSPWTMKLDPDERLTNELKIAIQKALLNAKADGFSVYRRLWFMTKRLPIRHKIVRIWRTGACKFSEVKVNEHPLVLGIVQHISDDLEHHDSPDLEHWFEKQNCYTTAEAIATFQRQSFNFDTKLLSSSLKRRLWMKKHFMKFPARYMLIFLFHYLVLGACRAGRVGFIWSRLRADVYRIWEYKLQEMQITQRLPAKRHRSLGKPDNRVRQFD